MKQLKLTLIMLFVSAIAFGQSLERQVLSSVGEAVQNTTAGLSYTVGQEATASKIISTTKLTQGFQQANPEDFIGIIDLQGAAIQASVFPNPTVNLLQLKSNLVSAGIAQLNYTIIDLHGKVVHSGVVASDGGQIDVSDLAASTYTLLLQSTDRSFDQKIRFVKVAV